MQIRVLLKLQLKIIKHLDFITLSFSETKRRGQSDSRKKPRFSKGSKENQYSYPAESNNNNL